MLGSLKALLNPSAILVFVLALSGTATVSYLKGAEHARNKIEVAAARDEYIANIAYSEAIKAAASEIAQIKIVNKTIRQELEREVRFEPVYVDCRHPDHVKRLLNDIISGEKSPESLNRDQLSAPDPADR